MAGKANLGRAFEMAVEVSNAYYQKKGWAVIQKVPTPWTVQRRGKQIISAFPEKKSTVDFVGVANGLAIAFDAKSTKNRTNFPLQNIEQHQMMFLQRFHEQGGRAFFLIEFAVFRETYLVPFAAMMRYWEAALGEGRKSIKYEDMLLYPKIENSRGIPLDYLAAVPPKGEVSIKGIWA